MAYDNLIRNGLRKKRHGSLSISGACKDILGINKTELRLATDIILAIMIWEPALRPEAVFDWTSHILQQDSAKA
jgi:hypothetical protein